MMAEEQLKMSMSERRATYPLQERLKIYNPDIMARKLNKDKPTKLVVNGVNLLNNRSVDSDTAMDRLQQRRKTHNRVERRRRSNLNSLMAQLSELIPKTILEQKDGEKCHRAKILEYAIEYIQLMKQENETLHQQLNTLDSPCSWDSSHSSVSPSLPYNYVFGDES